MMPRERFVELVGEAIVALPQDMKAVLRVVEDPEIDDDGRIAAAGGLLHVLSGSNAIPGMRGILGLVDDVLVIRLVLERIGKTNPEPFKAHQEAFPELFEQLDEQLQVSRDFLGDLIGVLEGAAANVGKLNHQGHSAKQCATDEEASTWLYDAVQEAIVERLEFDEDEVHREVKNIDAIVTALRTRTSVKP